MLREVKEIVNQTREAFEDEIMKEVDKASREKKESIDIKTSTLPSWLAGKLRAYGYKLSHKDTLYTTIFWGTELDVK